MTEGKSYSDVGDFLGVVEKLQRATISFVLSVRPPVPMDRLGSHWKDFMKFVCVFRKYVENFKFR